MTEPVGTFNKDNDVLYTIEPVEADQGISIWTDHDGLIVSSSGHSLYAQLANGLARTLVSSTTSLQSEERKRSGFLSGLPAINSRMCISKVPKKHLDLDLDLDYHPT